MLQFVHTSLSGQDASLILALPIAFPFVAGGAALVMAALLSYLAHVSRHPGWSLGSAAAGVLLMDFFTRVRGPSDGRT